MRVPNCLLVVFMWAHGGLCRDEDKIMKSCYWPNEVYEPCFGGCAEVSCDNPRSHLRPCYPYCEPGCVCEDPYVRDDRTHQCVLPQDCSPTQMGIPVPSKTSGGGPTSKPTASKYEGRMSRAGTYKRNMPDTMDDIPHPPPPLAPPAHEDWQNGKRADISRMGNYFNIVIAPPPIKTLQPRKMVQNDAYRSAPNRFPREIHSKCQ